MRLHPSNFSFLLLYQGAPPVLKILILALCVITLQTTAAWSQALPTASRAGDLQLGGGLSIANPDYSPNHFFGAALYGTFDFKEHWGVEAEFHHVSGDSADQLYERTYEIGGRYLRHYGPLPTSKP